MYTFHLNLLTFECCLPFSKSRWKTFIYFDVQNSNRVNLSVLSNSDYLFMLFRQLPVHLFCPFSFSFFFLLFILQTKEIALCVQRLLSVGAACLGLLCCCFLLHGSFIFVCSCHRLLILLLLLFLLSYLFRGWKWFFQCDLWEVWP